MAQAKPVATFDSRPQFRQNHGPENFDKLNQRQSMPPKTATVEKEKDREKEKPTGEANGEAAKLSAARQRDLESAISTITKTYGDGSIMRLGDARAARKIEVIPTGALSVDLALGVGGLPRGRVVEIFGPESSGKTTLMLHVIASAQKNG